MYTMTKKFSLLSLIVGGVVVMLGGLALPVLAQACGTLTVQQGDTLYSIAQRCGVTVPAIIEDNIQINEPDALDVGETLTIPDPANARSPQVSIYPQSVRPGDRVTVIANGFPLTTSVRVGAGVDGSEIQVSQTLTTDRQGALQTALTIPPTADFNGRWVIVAETMSGMSYSATSFPFFINEETTQPATPEPTTPPQNLFTQTDIYLIQENTGGSVGCGDSVIPYTVSIEPTVAPLTAAYNRLFEIGSNPFGYRNELGMSTLRVEGIDIENGVATVELSGNLSFAGVCSIPRIQAQLRQTALQYRTIDSVTIFVNGQPLDDLLDLRGQ